MKGFKVSGCTIDFDTKEVKKFEKTLKKFGEAPMKQAANKSAIIGANVMIKALKAAAPVGETGTLKNAIVKRKERVKQPVKTVYRILYSTAQTAKLQKQKTDAGIYGSKGKDHAYYPASVEFGFLAPCKGGGFIYNFNRKYNPHPQRRYPSRKTDGSHFFEKTTAANQDQVRQRIVDEMNKQIDKIWSSK